MWLATLLMSLLPFYSSAQELQAKVTINHSQIQGTDNSVFENLQQNMEQFLNDRQWTSMQFQKREQIVCSFNITVTKYDKESNKFTCKALIQANRPVFDSAYSTILYSNTDNDFNFEYSKFDNLVNNAQMLNFTGWKSFDNNRNRFAIINDYLEESLKPMRQLQYDYYRTGLDEMATNVERGRTNITSAIENNLKIAHENRPMSLLPQIWTDYKKDELGNIYNGHGNQKEKQSVYDILMSINASQNNTWDKILK